MVDLKTINNVAHNCLSEGACCVMNRDFEVVTEAIAHVKSLKTTIEHPLLSNGMIYLTCERHTGLVVNPLVG